TLDAEHERAAVRFGHRGKQMLRDRVYATLATPLNCDALVNQTFADGLDPFRLKQEMVIDKINRAVPEMLEVLELLHDVLRSAGAPFAFVEDWNVAKDARPRTAARGLHGRESLQREHGGNVQWHRFHKIQRQTLPVGEWPLVEIAFRFAVRVVDDLAVLGPGQTLDLRW